MLLATLSGTAAIAGREDGASGSYVVASLPGALHSGDDDADGGFPGALMGRATLAGVAHSADGGAAGGFPGALMVRATLAGAAHSAGACIAQACGGEHSSVPARFFRACGGGHLCSSRWMWCRRFCLRFWGASPQASGA